MAYATKAIPPWPEWRNLMNDMTNTPAIPSVTRAWKQRPGDQTFKSLTDLLECKTDHRTAKSI